MFRCLVPKVCEYRGLPVICHCQGVPARSQRHRVVIECDSLCESLIIKRSLHLASWGGESVGTAHPRSANQSARHKTTESPKKMKYRSKSTSSKWQTSQNSPPTTLTPHINLQGRNLQHAPRLWNPRYPSLRVDVIVVFLGWGPTGAWQISPTPTLCLKHFLIPFAITREYRSGSAISLSLATIRASPRRITPTIKIEDIRATIGGHLVMQRPFNLFPCYIPPTSLSSYSEIVIHCFPVALGLQVRGLKLFHKFYLCPWFPVKLDECANVDSRSLHPISPGQQYLDFNQN